MLKQITKRRIISLLLLAILMIFFALTTSSFTTANNMLNILREAAVVGIIGIGVTFVIITGGIDLSTGALMAVVGMTMANIYRYTLLPIWVMILAGIIIGVALGFFNGFIISKFNLPPFIATLSTMGMYRALTYIISIKENGLITSQSLMVSEYTWLGGDIGGVHIVTIAFVVLSILGQFILKYTSFGTQVYAVGANLKASQLTGINHLRIKTYVYAITGFCVSIGAIFTTARLQSTNALLGQSIELEVIAAIVVGGAALAGGKGDIVGTFIGAVFISALNNGIFKLDINTAYQLIIKGSIIIAVVIFDFWFTAYSEKRVVKQKEAVPKEGALVNAR